MPLGCTADGHLDESKYSEPMPWIGIYVAAASAICAAAMAVDVFHGLRYKKLWFPCKFFSLNATTLTIIAVASKLSVDLNTSMPRHQDQLAKLSSGVLICTVMSYSMPSIGTMETSELSMNIMALGIFVVTAIVNIGIQLGTGVIYIFWKEHAAVMLVMFILLMLLISSALTVPKTKGYFDLKYNKRYKMVQRECCQSFTEYRPERLKDDLIKYWMMAHTCSPQFVVARLVTCTASGAFCLLSTVLYAIALIRSYVLYSTFRFCSGESEYKWSTTLILVTQTIAIFIGSVAPTLRWFTAINYRCPKKLSKACKRKQFNVEDYWIRSLVLWKESPLNLRKRGRLFRKLAHNAKDNLLDLCIRVQTGMVFLSKLVRLVSLFWVNWLLIGLKRSVRHLKRYVSSVRCQDSESDSQGSLKPDLSRYVLHLEGEEALIDIMMESNFDVIDHWIKMGKTREPKNLLKLMEKWDPTIGLMGVSAFDNECIPSLDSEEPPNCWALPVVTLTSIAVAISRDDELNQSEELIRCVHEAMMYLRFMEDKLDKNGNLTNLRKAAEVVWVGVDLHYKWLNVDLRKMGLEAETPELILKSLSERAKQQYLEYKQHDRTVCYTETPSKWPAKILAANSMYRICQSLLLNTKSDECNNTGKLMFERLCDMITGIVGAALTNLPRVIIMLCNETSIEERESCVRFAIILLGKAGRILDILSQKTLPYPTGEKLMHIDDWRALSREKDSQNWDFSSTDSDKTPSSSPDKTPISSPDLYLTVE